MAQTFIRSVQPGEDQAEDLHKSLMGTSEFFAANFLLFWEISFEKSF